MTNHPKICIDCGIPINPRKNAAAPAPPKTPENATTNENVKNEPTNTPVRRKIQTDITPTTNQK